MPLTLTWHDIALRLALSLAAGGLIGLDRGEHGRPAGFRTTLLVCLAASAAMIQVNLLLATAEWRGSSESADVPPFVRQLLSDPKVLAVQWKVI